MDKQADVVVLGAGVAGYVCAIRLAQLGKKVTVIERAELGGVCLNRGCIPSKALIYAGGLYEKMHHASDIGFEVQGVKVNFSKLIQWKNSVVSKLTGGVSTLLKANQCTVIAGQARFTGQKTLEVKTSAGTDKITFNQCVIASGSRPTALKGFDVDQKLILDSTGALDLQQKPKSLLCIGGGYIGLELGTFFAKMGTQVTVVEATDGLLAGVDPELTKVVAKKLEKLGVKVLLKTLVKGCKKERDHVEVTLSDGTKEQKLDFEKVLVTIGRTPNSEDLGLEALGLKADPKGFLQVDAQRRTSSPGIYAIGDIAGQPLLAHKGSKEGLVAAEAIAGMKTIYDVVAMPAVIFTDPEISTVGLTEAEAKTKGFDVKLGKFPYAANGRALSVGEPDGFVKIVGDGKSGKLLGVHIVGAEASNLISEAALALEMGAYVEDLALTVHPHPTLPEVIMEAAEVFTGHPIHIFSGKR
jgi:dihydrolipoamide dehydrogenase